MPQNSVPRLMVFDSGLGGLTVLRALRQSVPEAAVTYLADDARFPYAALSDAELAGRVCEVLEGPVAEFAPDAIVIACNTASTTALPALRAAFPQPVIGTVPAIEPAALLSRSGLDRRHRADHRLRESGAQSWQGSSRCGVAGNHNGVRRKFGNGPLEHLAHAAREF